MKRSSQPRKTTPRTDRKIQRLLQAKPLLSSTEIKRSVPKLVNLSIRTIRHRLNKDLKLPNRKPLHQSTAASTWWCGPRPRLSRNGCWPSRGSQLPRGTQLHFFAMLPLNNRRMAAHSFLKIGRLFSLFLYSCPSLALLRLLILLLLLMSGNIHPNPGPIFPCSVCALNMTWKGKSVQCCACHKWVHLRCSQLPLSKFRAVGSSHSRSFSPCRNTVTPYSDSSDMYTSTVQSGPPLLMLHSRPTLVSKPLISLRSILYLLPLSPHHRPLLLAVLLRLLLPLPPDSFRVLQWSAGGLRARSTEVLYFLWSHPVDLICIQESNPNSFSSFRITGFSALRSDSTHSRSGILSHDATHASGGVVIFVRQGLSFSKLSTSSLSSLDPYSDYLGINISLSNSYWLLFLNAYAPLYSLFSDRWQNRFLFSFDSSLLQKSLYSEKLQLPLPTPDGRKYSTGSSLLISYPQTTLAYSPFSIAPLAVAPFLTTSLLLPLSLFCAPGRSFRTWVLITYQFFYLSLSLRSFTPKSGSFLQFSKSSLG